MSYDDWKTDPDWGETRRNRMRTRDMLDAVRNGWGEYDNPLEARLCCMAHAVYKGKHGGEPFEGIPRRDYPWQDI